MIIISRYSSLVPRCNTKHHGVCVTCQYRLHTLCKWADPPMSRDLCQDSLTHLLAPTNQLPIQPSKPPFPSISLANIHYRVFLTLILGSQSRASLQVQTTWPPASNATSVLKLLPRRYHNLRKRHPMDYPHEELAIDYNTTEILRVPSSAVGEPTTCKPVDPPRFRVS